VNAVVGKQSHSPESKRLLIKNFLTKASDSEMFSFFFLSQRKSREIALRKRERERE
jgi:hypothetical protein